MSKQLYIVYETDEWHSTASRDCKGVFMSKTSAIRSITKNHSIKLEELFDLTDIKMTPINEEKSGEGSKANAPK